MLIYRFGLCHASLSSINNGSALEGASAEENPINSNCLSKVKYSSCIRAEVRRKATEKRYGQKRILNYTNPTGHFALLSEPLHCLFLYDHRASSMVKYKELPQTQLTWNSVPSLELLGVCSETFKQHRTISFPFKSCPL